MTITNKKRFEIFRRDSFTCQYCGKRGPTVRLEVDHIVPTSKGGPDDDGNLLTACFECNRGKSNSHIIDLDNRLSEADYIYQLIKFPVDINRALEILEKHLHTAIVECLKHYPSHIVCMAVILEQENIDEDCDFKECENEENVISMLDENCYTLQEHWDSLNPYKMLRSVACAVDEAKSIAFYQLEKQYELVPKNPKVITND